jgi:hypothetical protein
MTGRQVEPRKAREIPRPVEPVNLSPGQPQNAATLKLATQCQRVAGPVATVIAAAPIVRNHDWMAIGRSDRLAIPPQPNACASTI